MSHYTGPYGSPYAAGRRRPARWPWTLALVILIALASVSGILVSDRANQGDEPDRDSIEAVNGDGTGGNNGQLAGANTAVPAATETPIPMPTATVVDKEAPTRTAESWLAMWASGDYNAMYDLTTREVQVSISRDAFTSRYSQIATKAGIISVTGKVAGPAGIDGMVPVEITQESSLVGPVTERNMVPVVRQNDEWRVAWTPSLIFRQLGNTGCVDFMGEIPARGKIYDSKGNVLAEDAAVSRIGIVPADLVDPDTSLPALSRIIDVPVSDIEALIYADGWDPAWLVTIKDLPGEPTTELLNQIGQLDGVQVKRATTRTYPQGALTAHITGWVSPATQEDIENDETGSVHDGEMMGRSGLEYGANTLLAGKPGGRLTVIECDTRAERNVIAESKGVPAQDVHTTIDLDLQKQVDRALTDQESSDHKEGRRSASVILDPRTGAVLAMVSHPSFDPNKAVNNTFSASERALINDDVLRPQTNRATYERYPTGSIFKVITAAAAMHYLDYTGDTPIDCPAVFRIGDQQWNDWVVENGLTAQGPLTLHSGLVRSCNTVFYQIGAALDDKDPEYLPAMTRAFGLGAPTGIQYFPELAGTVPDPTWKQEMVGDGWATGDAVNLSIGQGFLEATPLQMASAYAAIANGGDLLRPFIVDTTETADGKVTQAGKRKVIGELPLDKDQVAELQSALREQTSNTAGVGSSKVFGDFPWPISGKTGTAQNGEDPDRTPPHSWFAAYGGPDEDGDATITSIVLVENVGEGVSYAAPATKEIYDWYRKSDLPDTER